MRDKIRKCDRFGAGVSLNYAGDDMHGTFGGGIATFCLHGLILAFFVM